MNSFYSKKLQNCKLKYYIVLVCWLLTVAGFAYLNFWHFRIISDLKKENKQCLQELEDCIYKNLQERIKEFEDLQREYEKNLQFFKNLKNVDAHKVSLIIAIKVVQNKQIGLTSEIIHAILETESSYDIDAVSHKGAIGWMQLMEQTAKTEMLSLKIPFSKDLIKTPEFNLLLGIEHLIYLRKELLKRGKTEWFYVFYAYYNGLDATLRSSEVEILSHFYVGKIYYALNQKGVISAINYLGRR